LVGVLKAIDEKEQDPDPLDKQELDPDPLDRGTDPDPYQNVTDLNTEFNYARTDLSMTGR
jgi:hypothetical protein